MEIIVPEESKAAFLERTQKVQSFIRTLPGFVDGFLYQKKDGESRHNFLTTAVWENEAAFENAEGPSPPNFKRKASIPRKREQSGRSIVRDQVMKDFPIRSASVPRSPSLRKMGGAPNTVSFQT